MKYNILPGTHLRMSALSLGTMMFGSQTPEKESLEIMDYAYEHGINVFDTADVYANGGSERLVGKGLKGRREKIILATKVGGQTDGGINKVGLSRHNILNQLNASLKNLDTEYVDLYYLHMPDYFTDLEETMYTMNDLIRLGKIRYIGVSNYAAWQIADILALCDKRGYAVPIVTQNVYNLFTRGIESELIPFIKHHKIGMTIYNPIAGGLLTGKHKPGAPHENTRFSRDPSYYKRYWSDENFTAVEKLRDVAESIGLSLLELALNWCDMHDYVTSILSGVSKLPQLEQNIKAIDAIERLDQRTLEQCDEVWKSLAGTRFAYNR